MNVLIFDDAERVGALVRATLLAGGHRVSLEADPATAARKLDTALFDALVFGPRPVPESLTAHIEETWPTLPLVLAGVERELPPAGSIRAILARPLSVERLAAAMRRIEMQLAREARQGYDMPVEVIVGEQRLACRIVRMTRGSVMIEPPAEAAVEGPLAISRGDSRFEGEIVFSDRRLWGIRVAPEAVAQLASPPEPAVAQVGNDGLPIVT